VQIEMVDMKSKRLQKPASNSSNKHSEPSDKRSNGSSQKPPVKVVARQKK